MLVRFWEKMAFIGVLCYTPGMSKINEFVRELMPGRSEADIEEAERNLQEYLLVVNEMAQRLEREGKEINAK